jgi:hypothetical protein
MATHAFAATREPAMAAFAKSWRREQVAYSLTRRSQRSIRSKKSSTDKLTRDHCASDGSDGRRFIERGGYHEIEAQRGARRRRMRSGP